MRFGASFKEKQLAKYAGCYFGYASLKKTLYQLAEEKPNIKAHLIMSEEGGYMAGGDFYEEFMASEMAMVETFMQSKGFQTTKMSAELVEMAIELEEMSKANHTSSADALLLKEQLAHQTDQLAQEVMDMDEFRAINYTAVRKISKKAAKQLRAKFARDAAVVGKRLQAAVWHDNLCAVLPVVSEVYSLLRGQSAAGKWIPPQSFERSTKKYWVRRENLVKLNFQLVKHLPVLVFGQEKEGAFRQLRHQIRQNTVPEVSSWITSVYMDNAQHDMYNTRLARAEGARLLRLRWYGLVPEKFVFVERKTHHEDWVGEGSVKERFQLKTSHAHAYFHSDEPLDSAFERLVAKGKMERKEADKSIALAREVKHLHSAMKLKASIRSIYRRTAFQQADSNKVRVTLDCHLHLADELQVPDGQLWRHMDQGLESGGICSFPYGILEIKLQDAAPPFIQSLLDSGMLVEVTKFSKFLSACALLHYDSVATLPHWMDDASINELLPRAHANESPTDEENPPAAKPRTLAEATALVEIQEARDGSMGRESGRTGLGSLERTPSRGARMDPSSGHTWLRTQTSTGSVAIDLCSFTEQAAKDESAASARKDEPRVMSHSVSDDDMRRCLPWAGRHRTQPITTTVNKKIAPRTTVKIEPKTFFANERTFIQWLSAATLLVTLSILLLGSDLAYARTCGFVVMPVAAVFCVYAMAVFEWRRRKILRRDPGGYDDPLGPALLTAALLAALVGVAYISYMDTVSSNQPPPALAATSPLFPEFFTTVNVTNASLAILPLTGISTLEIQPSGLAVLPAAAAADGVARLLIPSVFSVLSTPLAGGLVSIHVPVPGMDLEDMQVLPDVDLFTGEPSAGTTLTFLLAENVYGDPSDFSGKIVAYDESNPTRMLTFSLDKFQELSGPEGLAFFPDERYPYGGLFFVGDTQGMIIGFELTPPEGRGVYDPRVHEKETDALKGSVEAMRLLNSKYMNYGLKDTKIAAMQYEDGLLYILYDNEQMIRVWALDSGVLRIEYRLGWVGLEVEGFVLLPPTRSAACAATGPCGDVTRPLYLAVDTPPALLRLDLPVVS